MMAIIEIKLIMRTSIVDEHIESRRQTRNMNSTTISNRKVRITYGAAGAAPPALMFVAHVVEDEVAEVGEEVIVREVVATSSRASALPKNLIAPLLYRITRGGVSEACCPFSWCTPKGGMEKTCLVAQ